MTIMNTYYGPMKITVDQNLPNGSVVVVKDNNQFPGTGLCRGDRIVSEDMYQWLSQVLGQKAA